MLSLIHIFLAHNSLVKHDSILIVISLPGHERHLKVAAQCELACLGRVTLGQNLTLLDTVARLADRTKVDSGALVGLCLLYTS